MTSDETIGQRIRRLRSELTLTQRDLAGPGLSYAHVSRIEAGERRPSPNVIDRLARRLGVSPDYLETGRRVPGHALRERRLADAELELRLEGDLARAEAVFRSETDPESGLAADEALAARAHANLGLLATRRSATRATIVHLEAATGSGYLHPASRPDLYVALGEAYTAYGAPAKAIELFERCLAELGEDPAGNAAVAVAFLTYLALAASALGDGDRVRKALADAEARADAAEVPQLRIRLYWALARAAWGGGRSEAARELARQAISLLEGTEDTMQLARAHILCAQMSTLDGEIDEAEPHLIAAAEGLASGADGTDLGLLRAEQAKLQAARGNADAALSLARQAERLLGDDVRYGGTKWHALGAARAAAGDVEAAWASYRTAIEVLEERQQWREAAQITREAVRFLRAARREAETWALLDRVAALAARRPLGSAHVG